MTDFGTLALANQGTQAAVGIASGYTESNAILAQSRFDQAAARENAKLALERGSEDVTLVGRRAKQIEGAQRAGYARQGLDVNSGSALDAQLETQQMSEMDKLVAKNNALREAYGIRTNSMMQAAGARQAASSRLLESYTSGAKDLVLGAYYYDQFGNLKKASSGDLTVKPPAGKTMSDPRNR